jgi:hypothetical protein
MNCLRNSEAFFDFCEQTLRVGRENDNYSHNCANVTQLPSTPKMNQKLRALAQHLFFADTPSMSGAERRRSTLGGFLGMGFCAWLLHMAPVGSQWLLALMGASAVILFALPHSPLAQP